MGSSSGCCLPSEGVLWELMAIYGSIVAGASLGEAGEVAEDRPSVDARSWWRGP